MGKYQIDILCLQETKINSNSKETHQGYDMYWSSDVADTDRANAEALARTGRASRRNEEHCRIFQKAKEHLGVGIVFSKQAQRCLKSVRPISARNIVGTLIMQIGDLDIVSSYAPQACHTDPTASDKHYQELHTIMDQKYAYSPKIICGDFNARLIKALPTESSVIGPFTFGANTHEIDFLSDAQFENRSRLIEFCLERNMIIKNTFLQKAEEHLITYRAVGVRTWEPPFTFHKYAQMDYFLVNSPWKNSIQNIESTYIHTIDTDHKLLIAEVLFKLKVKPRQHANLPVRFHKPTEENLTNYNSLISYELSKQKEDLAEDQHISVQQINQTLSISAKASLPLRHPKQKKEFISEATWRLLEQRWSALEAQDWDLAATINIDITQQVKHDKENHLLEQLEEINSSGYQWSGLKRLRSKFTPQFSKVKDRFGNYIPLDKYAEAAADYLENIQWGSSNPAQNPTREHVALQDGSHVVDDSMFTLEELDSVIARIKNNKTPGEDGVVGELFKWLSADNRQILLDALNQCLVSSVLAPEHLRAVVVSIYKKGDSSQLENYRPISLLNTCYKILAALIKDRLDKGLDKWITPTQYGFRKSKSTAEAIYLARRLQDYCEKSKSASTLILLDWEKAFDKVLHSKMIETLQRLKVPAKIIKLIQCFYSNPDFKVSVNGIDSDWKKQKTGIRQGCPLSPYLFCLVMSAMFTDIKSELNTPKQRQPFDGISFAEILFADDTLIFGANTHCINVLLHAIERHSAYFGLKLNYSKCINLTANQRISSVRFSPNGPAAGALVPRKSSATYLGTLLTDSFNNKAEVANRLNDCIATCNRLKLFWKKARTSIKWKIQVFNAIIRSKLLYSLECIQLTQAEISKLNGFQNKSLRRILDIPPTFIDRQYTNERMYDLIKNQYGCHYESFGETWRKRKCKFFGHILRCRSDDPLFKLPFLILFFRLEPLLY